VVSRGSCLECCKCDATGLPSRLNPACGHGSSYIHVPVDSTTYFSQTIRHFTSQAGAQHARDGQPDSSESSHHELPASLQTLGVTRRNRILCCRHEAKCPKLISVSILLRANNNNAAMMCTTTVARQRHYVSRAVGKSDVCLGFKGLESTGQTCLTKRK
jgi:hypothetical protein